MEHDELLVYRDKFKESIQSACKDNIEKSESVYPQDYKESRDILQSIIAYLLIEKSGVPGNANELTGDILYLLQVFNQGLFVTEEMISSCQYFKASVCLKQDIETLTRIRELKKGTAKRGKTPNVKHSPIGTGEAYGILNKIGHVAEPGMLKMLVERIDTDKINALSPKPVFNAEYIKEFFESYIQVLLELTKESIALFHEMHPDDDENFFAVMEHYDRATKLLGNQGFQFKPSDI